ncbi:MAG: hypothetical protein K6T66_15710 [Peptococcaceae bacterium]|nr:hypothetical protein [Peptococcaceae bacterium]
MPKNNSVSTAWGNFINTRQEEAGRAVSGDPQFSRLFDEYQGTIDALISAFQGGAAVSPVELVDRLERLRGLNDELMAIVEGNFFLAGLEDGIAIGQVLLFRKGRTITFNIPWTII